MDLVHCTHEASVDPESLSPAWICKGPVTFVCQAMYVGDTGIVLSVDRFMHQKDRVSSIFANIYH